LKLRGSAALFFNIGIQGFQVAWQNLFAVLGSTYFLNGFGAKRKVRVGLGQEAFLHWCGWLPVYVFAVCLDVFGIAWTCLDVFGIVWTCSDVFGRVWICSDLFGRVRIR
jgi:hypothetical protein